MKNHDDLIRTIKKNAVNICLFPLKCLPIQRNKVMLVNGLSFKYAGNPKAVGEYLAKTGKYDIYLAVNDTEKYAYLKDQGITPVKYLSPLYFRHAITAKIFVSNSGGYSFLPRRKNQTVINTWHGGGAYKKGGLDVCEHTKAYLKDVHMFSERTTLFLTTCKEQTGIFERAYLLDRKKILEIGMPRNDMLFENSEEKRNAIKAAIGLKNGEKLCLYAPTFRVENDNQFGDMIAGNYDIDPTVVCGALTERFGGSWRFAYRLHPAIKDKQLSQFEGCINLSSYDDMQDLLLAADILINDYSSSMWDFAYTHRPCFIFATDIEHYIKTTSWYTPMEKWPYSIARSNEELKNNILAFRESDYAAAVAEHYETLGCCENGKATETLCKIIEKICFEK